MLNFKKYTMAQKIFYIFVFLVALYIIYNYFTNNTSDIETFEENSKKYIIKKNNSIYDDFYVNIYDELLYSNVKNEYEIGEIINKTKPTKKSIILDVGSGTGHHIGKLKELGFNNVTGLDKSKCMINKSKKNYPKCNFKKGDILDPMQFRSSQFTHITCLYFTIYLFKDKRQFFNNCYNWLMPGGYLIVHLVNENSFDPIVPAGDVFHGISPQNYSDKRITSSVVKFKNNDYKANFEIKNSIGKMKESFKNTKTGKVRMNEHILYMPSRSNIVKLAKDSGFILDNKSDMKRCGYDNQYLYIFQKPNY